jgi:hypothetical protein
LALSICNRFQLGSTRVDRQIEDGRLELPGVDLQRPESRAQLHLELDLLAQDAPEKAFELRQRQGQIHGLRPERVATREGQQLAGQALAILDRLAAAAHELHELVHGQREGLAKVHLHQAEIAQHHREQVVEVMGDAAREPADGIELLSVAQGLLGLGPMLHFGGQAILRLVQLAGPVADAALQLLIDLAQLPFGVAHAQQGAHGGDQLLGLDGLDQVGIGAAGQGRGPIGRPHEGRGGLQDDDAGMVELDLAADLQPAHIG